MKEKRELIDFIVDRLKKSKEPPYKEGAWEKFRTIQGVTGAVVRRPYKIWYAAASVLLLFGLGITWYLSGRHGEGVEEQTLVTQPMDEADKLKGSQKQVLPDNDLEPLQQDDTPAESTITNSIGTAEDPFGSPVVANERKELSPLTNRVDVSLSTDVQMPTLASLKSRNLPDNYAMDTEEHVTSSSKIKFDEHYASLSAVQGRILSMKEVEIQAQNQNIRLSDRFALGVFVSPYATSQKMNVGGGLSLAYKLSKKLSVRTGASYNSYEVNILKDPVEESSKIEALAPQTSKSLETASYSAYQSRVVIPNINAVRGFVQSIDIPVEMKLNVNSSIYAVAGMSYSAILNQKRNAYYIENVNTETFANGYPENREQAEEAVKPVTKSVESTEKNVNTNGFSGFVNFSIGKEIRLNKKLGVSVEPYLKVPVGQFRRADMDYTNGGIRIMTNF